MGAAFGHRGLISVALRKESVDRNIRNAQCVCIVTVALRKESVDRNVGQVVHIHAQIPSLSARRAWIEITMHRTSLMQHAVALRKESVDRNNHSTVYNGHCKAVALRKESVDRNLLMWYQCNTVVKSLSARRAWIEIYLFGGAQKWMLSLSARRAWIEIGVCQVRIWAYQRRSPQGERG